MSKIRSRGSRSQSCARARSRSRSRARSAACGGIGIVLLAGLVACSGGEPLAEQPYDASGELTISPGDGSRKVDPDRPVKIRVEDGKKITDVAVTDGVGRTVGGELAPDGSTWHSRSPLGAGVHYTVRVSVADGRGTPGRGVAGFTTAPAEKLMRVVLGPDGTSYGVGQPVTAELSHPVKGTGARALVERGLKVTSVPAAPGRWHWVDDTTLHYRPEHYWPANATVRVSSTLAGARIADGLYGGPDHGLGFRTRDRVEALVDASTHRMTVSRNGKELRTVPVTTGKPGFETRNGVKVVLSQQELVRMTGTSIGIAEGSADSYDLQVQWATQVTLSGEYVHAAPWSVGSQGVANVSHGCVGMSPADAEWFYRLVRPGDLVEVVGSGGTTMTPFGNGYGDWNLSWSDWREGSALDRAADKQEGADQADLPYYTRARLKPLRG